MICDLKAKTETELISNCHGGTEVNLVTALELHSMSGSSGSLLNLEQKHISLNVEVFPGVFNLSRKKIGKWREAIKVDMNIRQSKIYRDRLEVDT